MVRAVLYILVIIAAFLYARTEDVTGHGSPEVEYSTPTTMAATVARWITAMELDMDADRALYILFAVGVLGLIYRTLRTQPLSDQRYQSHGAPEQSVLRTRTGRT